MAATYFQQRVDKLRRLLRRAQADAILVTDFTNVTYLTGFTGDDSYLLVTHKNQIILSDPRYTTQLEEECPRVDREIRSPGTKMIESVAKVVGQAKVSKLAVEAASMTLALRDSIAGALPKVALVPTANVVESLRQIKDKSEVAAIREAVAIAERAFGVIRASLTPEQTEKEIADEIDHQVRRFGGSGCSFPPIVAVGPRAALPHARAGDRRIGESDFVLIDWGAKGKLYMSDLTRVLATARISPKLERIYGVVLKAQQQGIAAIRAGALLKDVDAAARGVIEKAGFGKQFGHGLGHGVGLQIHEAPRLAKTENAPLQASMVVTVEPGIYLPGWGGVRIEDDVLVTRTGGEVLSSVPKEFGECVVG